MIIKQIGELSFINFIWGYIEFWKHALWEELGIHSVLASNLEIQKQNFLSYIFLKSILTCNSVLKTKNQEYCEKI